LPQKVKQDVKEIQFFLFFFKLGKLNFSKRVHLEMVGKIRELTVALRRKTTTPSSYSQQILFY